MIEQLRINLERAQATYRNVLRTIDGQLRALVSRDPALLEDAQAVQASYALEFTPEVLTPSEQPVTVDVVTSKVAIEDSLRDTTDAAGAEPTSGDNQEPSPEGQQ